MGAISYLVSSSVKNPVLVDTNNSFTIINLSKDLWIKFNNLNNSNLFLPQWILITKVHRDTIHSWFKKLFKQWATRKMAQKSSLIHVTLVIPCILFTKKWRTMEWLRQFFLLICLLMQTILRQRKQKSLKLKA